MRPEEYAFLYQLEETFWWFSGMRRITDTIVARAVKKGSRLRILDAGCGAGFNLAHYSAQTANEVFGLDISSDAVTCVLRRGIRKVCQASVNEIPFASETFDLVYSFDVICQGAEPPVEGGLREMARVLRPGGHLFVRVPAFPWMRSSHDIAVDTNRRFTVMELTGLVQDAGLEVKWISYANCFLFPAVVLRRALKSIGIGKGSDVRPLPRPINLLFRRILETEAGVFRMGFSLPFGLSVLCLARKP
jgi:SAM-dependent methyltransferase